MQNFPKNVEGGRQEVEQFEQFKCFNTLRDCKMEIELDHAWQQATRKVS